MSATIASLVRRHAARARSDVRRLSRTGAIAWDEDVLVDPSAQHVGDWTPSRRLAEMPEIRPFQLVAHSTAAATRWRSLSPLTRACVAREVLHRLVAVRESTVPAIGPWCGLEPEEAARFEGVEARHRAALAITLALRAQHLRTRRRRLGPRPLSLDGAGLSQTTEVIPRGVSLVFLGEESPCWAPYPAVFANLVAGNTLLVCPSRLGAESAWALVDIWRTVLDDHGLPADVVQLALAPEDDLYYTRELLAHHLIALIDDVTPSATSGPTLPTIAPQAVVRQEPVGRHVVLLDGAQDHTRVLAGLAAAARAGEALRTSPLLVVVPHDGVADSSGRLSAEQVAEDVRRVAPADTRPAQAWEVTVCTRGSTPLDLLDSLRRQPGVRAVHLVTADLRLAARASTWAHDAGVFLLIEDSHGGPIGDVRVHEAAALLDDDFVAPRLRTHHARLRA